MQFVSISGGDTTVLCMCISIIAAQWIRARTLNSELPGSNLLAAAVAALGKALYPHCLVPLIGLKVVGPLVACLYKQLDFLVAR